MEAEQAGYNMEGCPQTLCPQLGEEGPSILMGRQDQLVMASEHNPAKTPVLPVL